MIALATGGHAAAPKPQLTDPKGDAIGAQATTDIVSAAWNATGHVRKVAKHLTVTINLAGAPSKTAPFAYEASAEVAGCGEVRFSYTPGTVFAGLSGDSSLWIDCGPTDPTTGDNLLLLTGIKTSFGPKSITWTVTIKAMPKPAQHGSKWSGFRAAADIVDPVFGLMGTPDATSVDEGLGSTAWVLK